MSQNKIILKGVPGHCNITGNEKVDALTKQVIGKKNIANLGETQLPIHLTGQGERPLQTFVYFMCILLAIYI
jgi:hypothetical protein